MDTGLGIFMGVVVAAGLGVGVYALSKDSGADTALQQQNMLLQMQLQNAQQQAYQNQNAPISAQPTYQGQGAGGAVASVVDGLFQLGSLLGL